MGHTTVVILQTQAADTPTKWVVGSWCRHAKCRNCRGFEMYSYIRGVSFRQRNLGPKLGQQPFARVNRTVCVAGRVEALVGPLVAPVLGLEG